jgi:hypothetical protein
MKPIIKYISLLLFSGLILPFCFLKHPLAAALLPAKKATQSIKAQPQKPTDYRFLICPETLQMLFPILKSEKSM